MSFALKLFAVILIASQGHCVNILYLHGILSPSHHIWNSALARGLANRGHNITFLSTDPQKSVVENVHYIDLENSYENLNKIFAAERKDFDIIKWSLELNRNKLLTAFGLTDYSSKNCKSIMDSANGLEKILAYPDDFKFDLVIYDFTFGPCVLPIVTKFNQPPMVGVSAFLNPPLTHLLIGGNKYPAYVPHYALDFPQIMSFYQRSFNLLLYITEQL
jgi:glucuronosyltransferase